MVSQQLNVDEILRAKDFIRDNGEELITNFFIDNKTLAKLIERDEIKYSLSNKSLIVVREIEGVSKLYFFSVERRDLINSIRMMLPFVKRPISVEIFVDQRRADQSESLQNDLSNIGFKHHATQFRLTKVVSTNEYGTIEPEWYAVENDCKEIMEVLLADFDVLCDQVPETNELIERIKNKEVLVSREDGQIMSVILFKRSRALADWVFWVTRPEARKTLHGFLLREKYLELTGKVRRQITYTRKPHMKKFHTQVGGFEPDGFENHVYVLEAE